jgi:hypothetical protein
MPKTRGQKQKEEKKREKKQEPIYEFKNNPNFTPVATGDLRHSMQGQQFFYVKFQGRDYTHTQIQRFVQKIATKYHDTDEAKFIQVSLEYSNEGYRSSKISKVSEDLNLNFDQQYAEIQGNIIGFIIYLA